MKNFAYQGRAQGGRIVKSQLAAESVDAVAKQLQERGITPVSIKEVPKEETGEEVLERMFGMNKIPIDDLIMFSRQMNTLTKAGVPILSSLNKLADTTRSKKLAKVLRDVAAKISAGLSLARAMSTHQAIFSDLYVSMIEVGENTGRLDVAFAQITDHLRLEAKTVKRIKSATRYPTFVLVAITVAMVVINIFVIPAFSKLFSKFDVELPLATRVLLNTSDFMVNNGKELLFLVILLFISLRFWLKSEQGRYLWDKAKTKLPLIGELIRRIILGRFVRSFGMMLSAGLPLLRGLTLSANSAGNAFISAKITGICLAIEHGEQLTQAAHASGLFSPLVLQMLAVGEDSGSLDEMLGEIADYYESEVDYDLESLSAKIEPMLLIVIAVMVMTLALGVFLPMWNMANLGK